MKAHPIQAFYYMFIPFYYMDALQRSLTAVPQNANESQALKQSEG